MRVGVDVGGTFTDIVAIDGSGKLYITKALSTPQDQSIGVMDGLANLAKDIGQPLKKLLSEVTLFIHGTTVATNILIERKGARVGLITTSGFRDLLEFREGTKSDRYNLREPFPQPLIPRPFRFEVPERVRWDGSVEKPLDEKVAREVIRQLKKEGISSVVVCLLNSHRNSAHELRLRELIEEEGWKPYLSLSHEILGREGEYDRLSTSTVNSYVGPGLGRYLGNLVQRLTNEGLSVPVMVMQSTGGALPVDQAVLHAVGAITSGPAGGAMAGAWFSRVHGDKQFVTYDMGGTSTDICLIQNGIPLERQQTDFRDVKVAVSALDIAALGAGGGSIAKIDQGGILELGPESAGAQPGPACYGRGGELPTLTDANVVLGYISSDTFLGGRMTLSREAAVAAVTKYVAEPLSLSVEDASLAINALASTRIAEGIRASTVRRGVDPRDVSLFSFGGAGGLHADMVARELMIPKAVIPREASVLSALGFLSSDVRHDYAAPVAKTISTLKPGDMKRIFEPLENQGRELLRKEGFAESQIQVVRLLDCRYYRQIFSVEVRVDPKDLESPSYDWLVAKFEESYSALYQHVHKDVPGFIDACRVAMFGVLTPLDLPKQKKVDADPAAALRGSRRIYVGQWVDAPVYWFDDLRHGMKIKGPALVDSASTSVLIGSDCNAEIDELGSILLTPTSK